MNTLTDTLSTLPPHVRFMCDKVMDAARELFPESETLCPVGFYIRPGEDKVNVMEVPVLDDRTKPAVWGMLADLRKYNPTVAFISEVWVSEPKPGDGNYDPETGKVKVMPRDDPNRKELVMFNLWEGTRLITFRANITRDPKTMHEWEVFYDSHFPKKDMTSIGGAMMEGESFMNEAN